MSETRLSANHETIIATHPNWGAIWAGVFTFFAIWCVFGVLGMSIFASAGTSGGLNVGLGIWAVVLTIIAMYVAGRATGHLAGIGNARDGLLQGVVMFGLSVITALAVTSFGVTSVPVDSSAGIHMPYLLGIFANLGWFGFLPLFLGWLAAMGGASTGTHVIHTPAQQVSHA